jgi:hypothetical protein
MKRQILISIISFFLTTLGHTQTFAFLYHSFTPVIKIEYNDYSSPFCIYTDTLTFNPLIKKHWPDYNKITDRINKSNNNIDSINITCLLGYVCACCHCNTFVMDSINPEYVEICNKSDSICFESLLVELFKTGHLKMYFTKDSKKEIKKVRIFTKTKHRHFNSKLPMISGIFIIDKKTKKRLLYIPKWNC